MITVTVSGYSLFEKVLHIPFGLRTGFCSRVVLSFFKICR